MPHCTSLESYKPLVVYSYLIKLNFLDVSIFFLQKNTKKAFSNTFSKALNFQMHSGGVSLTHVSTLPLSSLLLPALQWSPKSRKCLKVEKKNFYKKDKTHHAANQAHNIMVPNRKGPMCLLSPCLPSCRLEVLLENVYKSSLCYSVTRLDYFWKNCLVTSQTNTK